MVEEPTKLKKNIGFGPLLLLSINAIIGTGIFFVPAIAAKVAGPASIFSWIGVSLIAVFIAMCFAELVGMYPKCGGIYEFAKHAFGRSIGFLAGWTGWIVANITTAMLVIGSFDYLGTLVPLAKWQIILFSILFVIFFNLVSIRGINMSIKVLLGFAIITIVSLWILVSWGIYFIRIENINPIVSALPPSAILFAMVFILETFFGWETVTYLAEETKNARKVIPKVLIYGTIAVVLLAIGVVVIALGVLPWQVLAQSSSPLVDAARMFIGNIGATIIAILVFLNIMGTAAAWIITTPRLIFALSRDNILPGLFNKVHKKYQTPVNAIILQMILTCFVISSGSYLILLKVLLPLAIVMYSVVILCIPKLRVSEPDRTRTFKVPLGKALPLILVAVMIFLMTYIEFDILIMGFFFILIGVPLYLFMALQFDPKISESMLDFSTLLTKYTYWIWAPGKLRRRIIKYFGNLKAKRILDFGCDIGKLSVDLAKQVGGKGHVFATEVSPFNLKSARRLAERKGVRNIISFEKESTEERENIHKKIRQLDGIVSIGTLGYVPHSENVLKEMHKRLKSKGKVYFIEYDRIFFVVRGRIWMKNDSQIRKRFKEAGFKVHVERERKLLWQVLHVYGEKV